MPAAPITGTSARGYGIPTKTPEADGTIDWDHTDLTVVEIKAGGQTGLGYTYGAGAVAEVIGDVLAPRLLAKDAFALPARYDEMLASVRNVGRPGIAAAAISAVDTALWDLKARLLEVPLVGLLGARRDSVAIYGSGGFTTFSNARTIRQFEYWAHDLGCKAMKMKVGAHPSRDVARVEAVHERLPEIDLMVDANGAYGRKKALAFAEEFADLGVTWFEEPVSSDDLEGLRLVRDRAPASIEIAAGEYAYDPYYVRRMLAAGAVDVMQLDVTRVCGVTGFLTAAALAEACHVPISAHTAPALHLAVCCAVPGMLHVEWFHDHARIEAMLFDGAPRPAGGRIAPDLTRPGHGLAFKRKDAERFAI